MPESATTASGEGWSRLGYAENPIQVDMDGVERMATDWRQISEAIQLLRSEIEGVEDGKLKSDAVDATKEKADDLHKKLEAYEARYSEAAEAAGVFESGIEERRDEAEGCAREASSLDQLGATKEVDGKVIPTQGATDDDARLKQLKAQLEAAVDGAEDIAKTFENAINQAKKHGKDTCMDKFKKFLKIILKVLMIIGMVLAAAGFIFGGWVILAMGVVVGVLNLIFTAINYGIGAGNLFDLITAIVFLGLDVLALGNAIKAGAAAFKMTKVTKVINSAKATFGGRLADIQSEIGKLQKNLWDASLEVNKIEVNAIMRGADGAVGTLTDIETTFLRDLKTYIQHGDAVMAKMSNIGDDLTESLKYVERLGETAKPGKLGWNEIFKPLSQMTKDDLVKWDGFVKNLKTVTSFDKGWASTFTHGLVDRLGFKDLREFIKGIDSSVPGTTTFGISNNFWKGLGIGGHNTFDALRNQWWGPFNFGNAMWETHGDLFDNEHDRTSPFSQWKADNAVTP